MKIIQHFIVNNDNFKENRQIIVKGLMAHSIGVPQPDAKILVRNFNVPRPNGRQVGVHGFMGEDGILYQTLPWNHRAWHCGAGANGSGNNTHIGIEITEPNTIEYTRGSQFIDYNPVRTREFVHNTYKHAVKHFAYLCRMYKLDPLADGVIISHAEGHQRGIASNHGDIDHIWNYTGLSMNQFRLDIATELRNGQQHDVEVMEVIEMRFDTVQEVKAAHPWAVDTVEKLINRKLLHGNNQDSTGLDLSLDMIRMFVINDLAGLYD